MKESLIKGGVPVALSTILLVCIDSFTDAQVPRRLLDLVVASLCADFFIVCVAFYSTIVPNTSKLLHWYTKYGLSATIMETLIGVIYMVCAYEALNALEETRLLYFGLLSIAFQWLGDLLFAAVFFSVPIGKNAVMDFFKEYAREARLGALLGDTFLMNVSVLLSSLFALISNPRYVAYVLIWVGYLLPFVVHTNTFDNPSDTATTPARKKSFRHIVRSHV